jgi:predicted small metal-binding protein
MRRVVECNACGELLAGETDEELVARMRAHNEEEHPATDWNEDRAKETVAAEAYDAGDS